MTQDIQDLHYYPYFKAKNFSFNLFKAKSSDFKNDHDRKIQRLRREKRNRLEGIEDVPNSIEKFEIDSINNHPVYQAFSSF